MVLPAFYSVIIVTDIGIIFQFLFLVHYSAMVKPINDNWDVENDLVFNLLNLVHLILFETN